MADVLSVTQAAKVICAWPKCDDSLVQNSISCERLLFICLFIFQSNRCPERQC